MNRTVAILASVASIFFVTGIQAATLDILWLTGNVNYNDAIDELGAGGSADAITYDPNGDGSNSWNIDFWSSGTPNFDDYDALVIGSTCRPNCGGSSGFFGLGVRPDLVLDNEAGIAAARGSRTFVSGQDADWHFINDSPGDSANARAFLINAVNWAGTGTGLGIVALADGYFTAPNGWLTDTNSFLRDEIGNAREASDTESVIIPAASAAFPINEGLTTAALSNWSTSSHTRFLKSDLPSGWVSINDFGNEGNPYAVTIVTASEADGGTTPSDNGNGEKIPEPSSTLSFLALGTIGAASTFKRKLKSSKSAENVS